MAGYCIPQINYFHPLPASPESHYEIRSGRADVGCKGPVILIQDVFYPQLQGEIPCDLVRTPDIESNP